MSNAFLSDQEKNNHIIHFIEKKLKKYEDIKYAYVVLKKQKMDDMVVFSNVSDYFSDVYLKNSYQHIDPVIAICLNRVSPLFWDKNLLINSKWHIPKPVDTIQPYHSLVDGQTFILHCPGSIMSLLSLYANEIQTPGIVNAIKQDKDEIQGILIQCYELFTLLYEKQEDKNCQDVDLTCREKEILYWISQGKTYSETSIILNIAVSTVKFHVANVVKKLGVNNAKHAIKLCEEMKLVPDMSGK